MYGTLLFVHQLSYFFLDLFRENYKLRVNKAKQLLLINCNIYNF
jgi:hypothetical protein